MLKYCFGIDVGGTSIKCGLFDVKGTILEKWEIPTRVENNGINILPDIAKTVNDKILKSRLAKDEIAGLGIGIPGPVNEEGEVPCAVNLHWGYVDINHQMERLTGLKVKAGNDANVAALGELWMGGGAGYKNMVLVTLGTGVGGGIIVNEKVLAGAHGAGGEIGHMHVEDDMDIPCNCGNCGCLEQFVSATGIVRVAHKVLDSTKEDSVLRSLENISAKSVWDAVKEKDAIAIQIADIFGTYLGKTLAGIASVTDPEVIVIGGGVSRAGKILLDYISKNYVEYAFPPCKDVTFTLAQLGNDAGIYGAAKLIL